MVIDELEVFVSFLLASSFFGCKGTVHRQAAT